MRVSSMERRARQPRGDRRAMRKAGRSPSPMHCSRCRHDNVASSRFCTECGARLAASCRSCGAELTEGVRFCGQCGQPVDAKRAGPPRFASPEAYTPRHLAEKILTSKSVIEGERKQVTVLFADLKGSMELLADRDPEETRKL